MVRCTNVFLRQFTRLYLYSLSYVAEDNNTRVLFERVLSSGSLEPEKSVYVIYIYMYILPNYDVITRTYYITVG